tara:strand:+ start:162 stop:911 length:750 start_codon:yes stop_codon:yes gene_type:complete
MYNSSKIEQEFKRIKNLGFIKSNRQLNKDGGIGNTFEDYLGVAENNLKDPDFNGFEIKTQRHFTSSYVTLFSKSPSYPKRANSMLKDKYGEVRDVEKFPDLKKLYASIFGDKWSYVYEKYNMKLNVIEEDQKVYLNVKEPGKDIFNEVYWSYDDLRKSVKKLEKLFIVFATSKKIDESQYYHYNKGIVYLNFNFNNFISMIKTGFIQFDLRMGVYSSGKNYGKPHDHGSGFRVRKENMSNLYEETLYLD